MGRRGSSGRGGGSFGGGGRSGGSFGGGGRGLSGGGRSGGSFGGGLGGNRNSSRNVNRPPNRHTGSGFGMGFGMGIGMGMGMNRRRRRSPFMMGGGMRGGRHSGGGCGSLLLVIILLLLVLAVVAVLLPDDDSMGTGSVTTSTIRREALPAGAADSSAPMLVDSLGMIRNETELNRGLYNFWRRTGVRPLLYITDSLDGEAQPSNTQMQQFAEARYRDAIGDNQAHMLFLFLENAYGEYAMWITTGSQARSVMDSEAQDILFDFVERYYFTDLEISLVFSRAFDGASERIMNVTTSPWIPVLIVVGVLAILLILFMWWKKRAMQKNLEAAQTERILSQSLETFDDEASRLAKQYEDE